MQVVGVPSAYVQVCLSQCHTEGTAAVAVEAAATPAAIRAEFASQLAAARAAEAAATELLDAARASNKKLESENVQLIDAVRVACIAPRV